MADANGCGALELGGVGDQDHVARIGHDCLRDLDLAKIEVEQCAIAVDGGGADHGEIDLELADEIDGCLADYTAIGAAHDTAGYDHLDIGVYIRNLLATFILLVIIIRPLRSSNACPTASVVVPMLTKQRGIVGDEVGGRAADGLLLARCYQAGAPHIPDFARRTETTRRRESG